MNLQSPNIAAESLDPEFGPSGPGAPVTEESKRRARAELEIILQDSLAGSERGETVPLEPDFFEELKRQIIDEFPKALRNATTARS